MGTLLVLDLVGTFVFALSGATAGVNHRLDLFGVLVVSFVTATAGGIMRDVLIGAVPFLGCFGNVAVKAQAGAIFIEPPPQPRPTANQRFMGDIDVSAVCCTATRFGQGGGNY